MLKDRVALISGAATGIGEAVERLFASHGAHTFMLDRDLAACRTVADSIVSAGGGDGFRRRRAPAPGRRCLGGDRDLRFRPHRRAGQ
jgi:NAD(P)-dependent dehydrogenase (short-subunit alcohol dehydrogenase family)